MTPAAPSNQGGRRKDERQDGVARSYHTPAIDPRLAEDIVLTGETILKRRLRDADARERVKAAVTWLLDQVRRELRGGGPGQ